jgi:RNA polymerase sigma-70 factor (ECF subfamily)
LQPLPEEDDTQDGHALVAEGPGPEASTMQADERRSLDKVMQTLPEEYREILILREIEDMDYREIAQVTGVPMGTVMSRLARARAALRKLWLQQHQEPKHATP